MKLHIKILSLLLACAAIFASIPGCAGQGDSKEDKSTIRVVLDWTPNTNHTGMYVALDKGYYSEEGLEAELLQPPEDGALALLGAGNAEFAVTFQESMAPAIASPNPLPVTAVAALIQHNTSGILSLKKTGIDYPRDLCGKKFATWGTPLVDEAIRQIVEADGGSFDEVEMVFDEATDAISALQTRIDAIWVYWGWDGIAARLAGVEANYMPLAEIDPVFDFYSPVLASNNEWLEKNPEKAKAFLKATAKGYAFAIENPDEAAAILLKYAPELSEDLVRESQRYLASEYQAEAARWGEINSLRWSRFYDWMFERSLLDRALGSDGFTNEFLPE